MLNFLKSRPGKPVPADKVRDYYNVMRWRALFGIFIGYAAYYLIRNNFLLSTPHLVEDFGFNKSDIGSLSAAMLIVYGVSKGLMSTLADKSNPKYFMIFGLVMSAVVNLMMGFTTAFWLFFILMMLNGIFQGMGAGPAYVILANWFPRKMRGVVTASFNVSHNVGGGLIAPITGAGMAWLGDAHWQQVNFILPVAIVFAVVLVFLVVGVGKTYNEGLPPLVEILNNENEELVATKKDSSEYPLKEILKKYILTNPNVWFVSFIDVFTYMIRFGVLTWLPLYLLETKGFSKKEMATAFAIFEWAAIPSTLLAGYVTDTYFKGRRMPLAIITLLGVGMAIFVYWGGESLFWVTFGAGVVGCLIYVPMFLSSLQAIELVPSFAAGSATGLRGLLSYVLGSFAGTKLFGVLVQYYGWNAGFYLLLFAVVACVFCCYMTHRGVLKLEAAHKQRLNDAA